MANKSTSKKKKSTSSKKGLKVVSKKDRFDNLKKIEEVEGTGSDSLHIVRTVAIIVIIFCAFYFLTLFLTNRDNSSSSTNTSKDTSISYSNIIAGRSFSMPEDEYLVLYYDFSDTTLTSSLNTMTNTYISKDSHLTVYYVDMSDALNKKYVSENSNTSPVSVSDLAINGPTVIHFVNGSVTEYIEGEEEIKNYFN